MAPLVRQPRLEATACIDLGRPQLRLALGDELTGGSGRGGCVRRFHLEKRLRPLARLAVLGDRVEEGEHPVVFGLADRVVAMAVALTATERQTEPDCPRRVDAIDDIVDARLLGVAAPFAVGHVITMKTSG